MSKHMIITSVEEWWQDQDYFDDYGVSIVETTSEDPWNTELSDIASGQAYHYAKEWNETYNAGYTDEELADIAYYLIIGVPDDTPLDLDDLKCEWYEYLDMNSPEWRKYM